MFKKLGDSLMAGLGAVVLTREKIAEVTQRLVDEAKLTRDEATRLNHELMERGETEWHTLEQELGSRLQAGREKLGFGYRDEIDRLGARVEDLEKKISLLESVVARQAATAQAQMQANAQDSHNEGKEPI